MNISLIEIQIQLQALVSQLLIHYNPITIPNCPSKLHALGYDNKYKCRTKTNYNSIEEIFLLQQFASIFHLHLLASQSKIFFFLSICSLHLTFPILCSSFLRSVHFIHKFTTLINQHVHNIFSFIRHFSINPPQ